MILGVYQIYSISVFLRIYNGFSEMPLLADKWI